MKEVITVGLDNAKHVFQVHGIDQKGRYCSAEEAPAIGDHQLFRSPATLFDWG